MENSNQVIIGDAAIADYIVEGAVSARVFGDQIWPTALVATVRDPDPARVATADAAFPGRGRSTTAPAARGLDSLTPGTEYSLRHSIAAMAGVEPAVKDGDLLAVVCRPRIRRCARCTFIAPSGDRAQPGSCWVFPTAGLTSGLPVTRFGVGHLGLVALPALS